MELTRLLNNVKDFVETAVKIERDLLGLTEKETENKGGKFDIHFQQTFEGM
jgi:hypothetical protein